jgi:hypothetical protein
VEAANFEALAEGSLPAVAQFHELQFADHAGQRLATL